MKFLEYGSLLKGDPARLAIFSTFQFDPDYFERQVLSSSALAKARRILVYMDAGQWFNLLRQDYPARYVNRRYLVVPVQPPRGVFHPKLALLAADHDAKVLCGSNNLTRAGCLSNLELLNSFNADSEHDSEEALFLAREAFAFFRRACDDAEMDLARLAREWLEDLADAVPWISATTSPPVARKVRLIHTYDGPIWNSLATHLGRHRPKQMIVISPFYDGDVGIVHRMSERWPECRIELVVQQNTTNLNVSSLKKMRKKVVLSELQDASRRLHAKLVAWESEAGCGCLVGSANLTRAAFDARNVETCLLVEDAKLEVEALFDRSFGKSPIKFDDFEPGTESEPTLPDAEPPGLRLTAAVLSEDGDLRVSYQHRLKPKPLTLRVALRVPGEDLPRAMLGLPMQESGSATVPLADTTMGDAHGTLLASLVAEVGGSRQESLPIWVVQEARLTFEPSGGKSSPGGSKVEETGEGLPEFLEELGKREGLAAVIEFLRHRNIRYNDGSSGRSPNRAFRLRIHDPFHPDELPHWLLRPDFDGLSLADAIYDFADRHERQRLRKHAERGNINGIENFLDILSALVRLLYVYYVRGVVPRGHVVGRLTKYLGISTSGIDASDDQSEGFLYATFESLDHDSTYLEEVVGELRFLEHLWAILLVAQLVRSEADAQTARRRRPGTYLPSSAAMLEAARRHLRLARPDRVAVGEILQSYNMLNEAQIRQLSEEFEWLTAHQRGKRASGAVS